MYRRRVPTSPYVRWLRSLVGHELLLLPSVAVLPWDADGRLLLARNADDGLWMTIGGSVEIGESPAQAARREAAEEAGIDVELRGIRCAVGGEELRASYPNGDQVAYVTVVYDAAIVSGTPEHDGDETTAVAWFDVTALRGLPMNAFTRALLAEAGVRPAGPP
jgi:8-oxo-dGTP pyrophosphatase MutT (NUDIX family)